MELASSWDFRFLDTEQDRQTLLADMRRVRRAVVELAEGLPGDRVYAPRYHGWSPAAMLAHLHFTDNISLIAVKLALLGLQPKVSKASWNRVNNITTRVFQRRLLATTITEIKANEARIGEFILQVPLERFTRTFYYPPAEKQLTVEQALQVLFLFHWQEHRQTIERTEGVYYEPPGANAG
ncbi:MAG: DinB family protein [Chloroflexi bacterium]|nr:DinB family protein [Chloroflexota bacterium]